MSTQLDTKPDDAVHGEASPDTAHPGEIQGVVDNVSAGRIFGWAWNPSSPKERVAIELRLGQEVVAQTVASQERSDLQAAGVGDGFHAFELRLTPELIHRRTEIFVVARTEDGLEVPLPILGARRTMAAVPGQGGTQGAALSRSVQMLSGAQRALQEQMADLSGRLPNGHAALQDLTTRLETLEMWCLRLDERLASQPDDAANRKQSRGAALRPFDQWQFALVAMALLSVLSGVVFAWIGVFPTVGAG